MHGSWNCWFRDKLCAAVEIADLAEWDSLLFNFKFVHGCENFFATNATFTGKFQLVQFHMQQKNISSTTNFVCYHICDQLFSQLVWFSPGILVVLSHSSVLPGHKTLFQPS